MKRRLNVVVLYAYFCTACVLLVAGSAIADSGLSFWKGIVTISCLAILYRVTSVHAKKDGWGLFEKCGVCDMHRGHVCPRCGKETKRGQQED